MDKLPPAHAARHETVTADGSDRPTEGATPIAVLVVARNEFEPDRLATHLSRSSQGRACVTVVSADTIPGVEPANASVRDYSSTAARIWQHLQRCLARATPVDLVEAGCNIPSCEQTCNQPLATAAADRATEAGGRAPAGRADGPCGNGFEQRPAAQTDRPITVASAAGCTTTVKAFLKRLEAETDFVVFGGPIEDPADLLSFIEARRPRLLLVDDAWLARVGPAAQRIRLRFPGIRVLVLAEAFSYELVEQILRNRFDGLLLAHCPPEACARAARAVDRGELWLPRALLARAITERLRTMQDDRRASDSGRGDASDGLTPRENEIVDLLRRGCTNKEIGRQLGIMEDTVKKHLKSVFAKLGVHRRALVVLR